MQWITHESWMPGGASVAFVDWPRGMRAIDVDTGDVRWITRFPAWHAHPDDSGGASSATPISPTAGCTSFRRRCEKPRRRSLRAKSSSEGAHWGGPFPYNDGPVEVEARAAHPSASAAFRPTARACCSPRTRSGHAQLYEVMLEETQ